MKAILIKNDTIADYGSIRLVSPTYLKEVDITPSLDEYYAAIGCDTVDFAVRDIEGRPYVFICDDVALLKDGIVATVISKSDTNRNLVGNVLVFGCDNALEPIALTDDDIATIKKNFKSYLTID